MAGSDSTKREVSPETTAETAPRRKHKGIFRDERGRWWIDFRTPQGKRRRKQAGKTLEDAKRALREVQTSIDKAEFVDTAKAPGFSEFLDFFMEHHGQHLASYRDSPSRIAKLKDYFGQRKISTITSGHILDYRTARRAEPDRRDGESRISLSTINREVTMIRSILSKAVEWGHIGKNPADRVKDHEETGQRERFLSNEDVRKLLQATKRTHSKLLRRAVYLALETGMRKGELLALRWQDVNFEASKILVPDSKSGKPRHVPMSRRARWLLQKMAASADPLAARWVFESKNAKGEPAPATDTKTAWTRVLLTAKIEDFHFHDLRHTFASHFAMKGGNLFALSMILGHSNPKMTLERYTHLSPEFIDDQRKIMDATYTAKA